MLFDLNNPLNILAKSSVPLLQPEAIYEKEGFFGNVVFTCGALLERGVLKIYYGAGAHAARRFMGASRTYAVNTIDALLRQFHDLKLPLPAGEKIQFSGVGNTDVYNLTAPFRWVIAARVEPRHSELSQIRFFEFDGFRLCKLLPDAPVFALQDPFFTRIDREFIFGGVCVKADEDTGKLLRWKTLLYRGADIYSLRLFFIGPEGMKDIRPVGLPDGKVLLFTSPQRETGGRGTIGYTLLDSPDDLTLHNVAQATLLHGQVSAEEWCGVNAAYVLEEHRVGVLGWAMSPVLMRKGTGTITPVRLFSTARRTDLEDVIFPGGLCFTASSAPRLYCGTSDCQAQWIEINDPFR